MREVAGDRDLVADGQGQVAGHERREHPRAQVAQAEPHGGRDEGRAANGGAEVDGRAAPDQRIRRVVRKRQRIAEDEHDRAGAGKFEDRAQLGVNPVSRGPEEIAHADGRADRQQDRLGIPERDRLQRAIAEGGDRAGRTNNE
jgi:hypothetical protein